MTQPPPFAEWSPELREELDANCENAAVGTRLLLEDEYARHWEIRLAPGERIAFHRQIFTTIECLGSANDALRLDGARVAA